MYIEKIVYSCGCKGSREWGICNAAYDKIISNTCDAHKEEAIKALEEFKTYRKLCEGLIKCLKKQG